MAAAPAGKPTGKVGSAVNAARTLTDPNATAAQKATEGAALAAQAAATAAGGSVAGAVAGQVVRSRYGRKILAAVLAFVLLLAVGSVITVSSAVQAASAMLAEEEEQAGQAGNCTPGGIGSPTGTAGTLSAEQRANATAILGVVQQRGLGAGDAVIAIMTALTESSLVNVSYGDLAGPDSRGLFQQRDSWGPLEVRMDPAGATGLFLDRLVAPGLKQYEGAGVAKTVSINVDGAESRATYQPWRVAQSVQISAFPMGENYRAQYARAVSIVAQTLGPQVYPDTRAALWADQLGPGDPQVDQSGNGEPVTIPAVGGGEDCTTTPPVDGPGPGAWGGYSNGQLPADAMCGLSWQPDKLLRCDAVAALEQLNAKYRTDFGTNLSINVTYRDLETQEEFYYCGCTPGPAAPPGTSNHGWGLAIDINGTAGNGESYEARKTTVVYRWMRLNAPSYLWRENVSLREAWHWEYMGAWTG